MVVPIGDPNSQIKELAAGAAGDVGTLKDLLVNAHENETTLAEKFTFEGIKKTVGNRIDTLGGLADVAGKYGEFLPPQVQAVVAGVKTVKGVKDEGLSVNTVTQAAGHGLAATGQVSPEVASMLKGGTKGIAAEAQKRLGVEGIKFEQMENGSNDITKLDAGVKASQFTRDV